MTSPGRAGSTELTANPIIVVRNAGRNLATPMGASKYCHRTARNAVITTVSAADTTIKISWDDWQAMADGQLDGMTAFMTGKLKVEGDMSNAMQLQGVLSKLRG